MPEHIDADDFKAESAPLIDNLSSALSGPTVASWFPKLGPLPTRPNELAAWSRRAYTYHALFDAISLVVSCLILSKDGAAGSELEGRFIRLGHYYYMSWPLVILCILTCVGLVIAAVLRLSCDGVVWWDLFIIMYNIAVPLLTLPLYGPVLYNGDQWQNDWPTTRNLTEQQWQQNLQYVFTHYNSVGHPTNHPHLVWIVFAIVSLVLSVVSLCTIWRSIVNHWSSAT